MSTQDTPSPHARLRELAEKATPGVVNGWNVFSSWNDEDERQGLMVVDLTKYECEFISAANPQVVLGLLDEIEGLRRALARVRSEYAQADWDSIQRGDGSLSGFKP